VDSNATATSPTRAAPTTRTRTRAKGSARPLCPGLGCASEGQAYTVSSDRAVRTRTVRSERSGARYQFVDDAGRLGVTVIVEMDAVRFVPWFFFEPTEDLEMGG